MVRHFPKIAFVAVLLFAAGVSVDLGPDFVRTRNVVVWYEPGITRDQAQAVLDFVARDAASDDPNGEGKEIKLRLMRESTGVRLRFDGIDLAKITPEIRQFFYDYGQRVGGAALAGEPVQVELSDGAGQVQPLIPQQPEAEPTEISDASSAISG
jgi:hypothetical protein